MLFLVLLGTMQAVAISIENLAKVFFQQFTNVRGLHGKQRIQLMDAHSLPHAYLDSAIATFG